MENYNNKNTVNKSFLRALGNTNPPSQGWSADCCKFLLAQKRGTAFEQYVVSQYSEGCQCVRNFSYEQNELVYNKFAKMCHGIYKIYRRNFCRKKTGFAI
jgi:hypothetical protein